MKLSCAISGPDTPVLPVTFFDGSLDDRLQRVAALGYDGVEILCAAPDRCDAAHLRSSLQSAGLNCPALGTGALAITRGARLIHADVAVRAEALRLFDSLTSVAAEIGCAVTVGSFRGWLRDLGPDKPLVRAHDLLRTACDRANSRGVDVLLEPLNRYETDFVNTAREALDLVATLALPNLHVLLDTFHMNIEEPRPVEAVEQCGARLRHVHLGDSNRLSPGKGHFDFAALIKALDRAGYDGWLSAEHLALPDAATAARDTISFIRPLTGGGVHG